METTSKIKTIEEIKAELAITPQDYLYIDGYFKDDKSEFQNYKVKLNEDVMDDNEDDIFYYFDSLESVFEDAEEFVITNINLQSY